MMCNRFFLFLLLSGVFLSEACYNRWTDNYNEFPDLSDSKSAILDESGLTEAEIARREKILHDWNEAPSPEYRINAGDKLSITVYNHADLAERSVVTPDGCIGFVFLGQVKLAGLTLREAAEKMEKELAQYIKNPSVGIAPY